MDLYFSDETNKQTTDQFLRIENLKVENYKTILLEGYLDFFFIKTHLKEFY